MAIRRLNWPILTGFLISLFALASYPVLFVNWPLTRDFPWANILLFGIALIFLYFGMRRAFGTGRGLISKIVAACLAALSVLVLGLFVMVAFVSSTWMPKAAGAPQVSQKSPDFTLADTSGKQVSLSALLSTPIENGSSAPKGVLLIFYRGYW